METAEQKQEGRPIRFGDFFLSTRSNGYIGCLEYIALSVIGWAAAGAAYLILGLIALILGGGIFAATAPMASADHYSNIAAIFIVMFSAMYWLCIIAVGFIFLCYHARLIQLRMIDIGLGGNVSVPGIASKFWVCFVAALVAYALTPLALILAVFCCVCQGKTYRDNRDLFTPIQPVPPADELARQMHERSEVKH